MGFLSGYDIQPLFAIPLATLWLIKTRAEIWTYLFVLTALGSISTVMLHEVYSPNRILLYYFGAFCFGLMYSLRYRLLPLFDLRTLAFAFIVYIFVATIQLLLNPEFLGFLVSRATDEAVLARSSGRGVRSLTGEPAQFGETLVALFLVFSLQASRLDTKSRNRYLFYASALTMSGVAFLAQSAYSLLFGGVCVGIVLIVYRVWRALLIASILGVLLLLFLVYFIDLFPRLSFLVKVVLSEPNLLLGQGAIVRLFNPFISLIAYAQCFPNPVVTCPEKLVSMWTPIGQYSYFVDGRVQGGLLEIGLFLGAGALPIFAFFAIVVVKLLAKKKIEGLIACFLLIQSGSAVNPLYYLVICFSLATSKIRSCSRGTTSSNDRALDR